MTQTGPLHTPDGRYIVIRGRLWRAANPGLSAHEREPLVARLMDARRALRGQGDASTRAAALAEVQAVKLALGERGAVWWHDGAPDFNRRMVVHTPYAAWFAAVGDGLSESG
jgi:hypothetical protein